MSLGGIKLLNGILQGGSGGSTPASKPNWPVQIEAGDTYPPDINGAPLADIVGTYDKRPALLFNDTTEEFALKSFKLPSDLGSGDVTFRVDCSPVTFVASKNVKLKIYHRAKTSGETWDAVFASKESGDIAIAGSAANDVTCAIWTETVANLGWAANDNIQIKLSRIAPGSNNLSGDLKVYNILIDVPRA
jgi:hypothetical protein